MARRKNWGELTGDLKELYERPDREAIRKLAAYVALTRQQNLPEQDVREETVRQMISRIAIHNPETLDEEILRAEELLKEGEHDGA